MKTLLLTFLTAILTLSAHGEHTEQGAKELLRSVRSKLPKGWNASYQKKYSWLEISRQKSVSGWYFAPNLPSFPGSQEPMRYKFCFSFRITETVSPIVYQRLSAENAAISKKLKALADELTIRKVSRQYDSFSPRSDPEKQLVARYEAIEKSLHNLPDFYFRDISLQWETGSPRMENIRGISIEDDHVREECRQVKDTVVKLLSKYEDVQQGADGKPPEVPQ